MDNMSNSGDTYSGDEGISGDSLGGKFSRGVLTNVRSILIDQQLWCSGIESLGSGYSYIPNPAVVTNNKHKPEACHNSINRCSHIDAINIITPSAHEIEFIHICHLPMKSNSSIFVGNEEPIDVPILWICITNLMGAGGLASLAITTSLIFVISVVFGLIDDAFGGASFNAIGTGAFSIVGAGGDDTLMSTAITFPAQVIHSEIKGSRFFLLHVPLFKQAVALVHRTREEMGVKGLWDILDSRKKTLPLHDLYKPITLCALKDKLYLNGLFHRIRALIALSCSLIFVNRYHALILISLYGGGIQINGSIPGIKVNTYRQRLHLDNEGREESYLNKTIPLQKNMGSKFSCMIKDAKILASELGVPCLDGIEEGEAHCALLGLKESLGVSKTYLLSFINPPFCHHVSLKFSSKKLMIFQDGCFLLDSDIFLFRARTIYRDICLGGYVVCYKMDDNETKLGLGRNSGTIGCGLLRNWGVKLQAENLKILVAGKFMSTAFPLTLRGGFLSNALFTGYYIYLVVAMMVVEATMMSTPMKQIRVCSSHGTS
ncbi:hypothetical protein LXL04_008228 [Taraxacum kok-saghyz]